MQIMLIILGYVVISYIFLPVKPGCVESFLIILDSVFSYILMLDPFRETKN